MSEKVTLVDVVSSQLKSIGYNDETSTLYVIFKNTGITYKYENVPESVYNTLLASSEVGKTFNSLVKGIYSFSKV